jgi:hypothetical protein
LSITIRKRNIGAAGKGFAVGGVLDIALPGACPVTARTNVPQTSFDIKVDLIIGFGV